MLSTIDSSSRQLARRRPQPAWVAPMLATLTESHFSEPNWVYEHKFDGVRCLVFREGDDVRLMSRNRKSMNNMFPEIVEAIAHQPQGDFVADGEIVAFDGDPPRPSFGQLQGRLGVIDPVRALARKVRVHLYLFDLLHVDPWDITALSLLDRKLLLKRAIRFREPIRYSDHRTEHGEDLFNEVCATGWEGIIAKRADSTYQHKRSRDWRKFKCINEQEFVIGGYTDPQGSRIGFGSLLVGYYDEKGELHYAGKVGTGYDDRTLRLMHDALRQMERRSAPFTHGALDVKTAHWVTPRLVAQVAFTEWTRDGRLRHPRFLGLRSDKKPKDVVRETV